MRYPDVVTRLRATGTDEYGNPARSWTAPATATVRGFLLDGKAFFPVGADVLPGDRLSFDGRLFSVDAVKTVRSPSRAVLVTAALTRIPEGSS